MIGHGTEFAADGLLLASAWLTGVEAVYTGGDQGR
jgi:hypothetical protein